MNVFSLKRCGLTLALFGLMAALAPSVSAGSSTQADLAALRGATARFHSAQAALDANYRPLLSCFDSAAGGMGQHYVDVDRLDAVIEQLRPEAMVYQVRDDGLQLVAVEYIAPYKAWTADNPPSLYGETFRRNDDLGLWVLHAWIWRPNPQGMFENYNPKVPMCPGR